MARLPRLSGREVVKAFESLGLLKGSSLTGAENMRSKVTEQGVVLPKQWFPGVDEVDIRRENNRVVVVPFRGDDPISELGKNPLTVDVDDASDNHDRYLYGQ
jgi:virulence-associated protein VagC